jgi:hypothetical protein
VGAAAIAVPAVAVAAAAAAAAAAAGGQAVCKVLSCVATMTRPAATVTKINGSK